MAQQVYHDPGSNWRYIVITVAFHVHLSFSAAISELYFSSKSIVHINKCKGCSVTCHQAHKGGRSINPLILNPGAKKRLVDQCYALAALTPGNRPGGHCTGGWVGLEALWMCSENLVPFCHWSPNPGSLDPSESYRFRYPAHQFL